MLDFVKNKQIPSLNCLKKENTFLFSFSQILEDMEK